MKKDKKKAIYITVIGLFGSLILLLISVLNELTVVQNFFTALAMFIFGCLFALGLISLSVINDVIK